MFIIDSRHAIYIPLPLLCYEYNLLLFVSDFVFYNVISALYIATLYMYMILVDYIYLNICAVLTAFLYRMCLSNVPNKRCNESNDV